MLWLRTIVVLAAAAGLGWLVVVQGLTASALLTNRPTAALSINPRSAEALSAAADQASAKNDVATAERLARAALVRMPRDVRALRVLGLASSSRGHHLLGSELLLRAGTLSWRDPTVQLWLVYAALEQRNFTTAAQRLDAVLRLSLLPRDMLRQAHQIVQIPEMRTQMVERLGEEPTWRRDFMITRDTLSPGLEDAHLLLLQELRAREGELRRREVVGFVQQLVERGKPAQARRLWADSLTGEARGWAAQLVFDGDFRLDPELEAAQPRYVFEWSLESGNGATAMVGIPPNLIGESALKVHSGEAEHRVASQTVMLRPGGHSLSYDALIGDGLSPQDFVWRVRCVRDNRSLRLSRAETRTVGSWLRSVQAFDVPADCPLQRIELGGLPARLGGTEAWFDHVGLQ
ncbi:MAG TPA: hypothetical protein VI168_12435 [Croceibacterium sp.]